MNPPISTPVYAFGPHADPSLPASLRDALDDAFPSLVFSVGVCRSVMGLERPSVECNAGPNKRLSTAAFQNVVAFARGFVAGYAYSPSEAPVRSAPSTQPAPPSVPVPNLQHSSDFRTRVTRPSTPAAMNKTLPEISLPEPGGPLRFPTQPGIAPPSRR